MREIRLLDVVSSLSGLMISDFHSESTRKTISHHLKLIKPEDYPLSEWNEFARYVFMDRELTFESVADLRMYFDNC